MKIGIGPAVGAVLVLLGTMGIAAQEDAFRAGMKARDDREWPKVVAAMEDAIRQNPAENRRRIGAVPIFGFGGNEYLPHFFLGEAHFQQGNCGAALAAWEESLRQGIVQQVSSHAATLQAGMTDCEGRGFVTMARLAPEAERADAAVRSASAEGEALWALGRAHPRLWTQQHLEEYERARADLLGARDRLARARELRRLEDAVAAHDEAERAQRSFRTAHERFSAVVDASVAFDRRAGDVQKILQEARRTADRTAAVMADAPVRLPNAVAARVRQARTRLEDADEGLATARSARSDARLAEVAAVAPQIVAELRERHEDVEQAVVAAVDRELRELQRSTREALVATEARTADTAGRLQARAGSGEAALQLEAIGAQIEAVGARVDRAVETRDLTGARQAARALAAVTSTLDALLESLGLSAAFEIPDALRAAAEAHFAGRYRDVLSALPADAAAALDGPLRVHAHLFRSAALFALFQYSGRADDALLQEARQEADRCRSLDAAFQPDPAAFAPAFLAFFAGGAAGR